jgi:predicted transcriptional regulator
MSEPCPRARELRELRRRLDISQAAAAAQIGRSKAWLCQIETGAAELSPWAEEQIRRALRAIQERRNTLVRSKSLTSG